MLNVGLTPKAAGSSSLYALSLIFCKTLKGPSARGINLDLRKSGNLSLRRCNQTRSPGSNTTCFLPLSPASLYLAKPDENMATIVTPTTPAKIPTGPITRDRPHQLNYPVLSFLGNVSNVYVNMILPNRNIFRLLINEGPGMDKKDDHWSMFKHEDDEDTTVMNMTINFSIFDQEMKSIQRGMIV